MGIVRQRAKYMRYKDLRHITQPAKGPFHFRAPTKMLYKSIRGMIPHKTKRGMEALGRLKLFEGVPPPYDKVKLLVIPDALRVLRLQTGHRFCSLGDLAHSVGWKFQGVVEELEAERKQAAQAYYTEKKAPGAPRSPAARPGRLLASLDIITKITLRSGIARPERLRTSGRARSAGSNSILYTAPPRWEPGGGFLAPVALPPC